MADRMESKAHIIAAGSTGPARSNKLPNQQGKPHAGQNPEPTLAAARIHVKANSEGNLPLRLLYDRQAKEFALHDNNRRKSYE
jgi:hypothetical protein